MTKSVVNDTWLIDQLNISMRGPGLISPVMPYAQLYSNLGKKSADAVLLARLQAGHTPLLKAYAHLLNLSADPLCPLCKEEPPTTEHWLRRCPGLDATT